MANLSKYGPWALVTGASSGIGAEFSRQLAEDGINLVLTARRKERLDAAKEELEAAFGIQVETIPLDLAAPGAVEQLVSDISPWDVGVVINNAGFGEKGRFMDIPLEKHLKMVEVNIRVPMELAHRMLPKLESRGGGAMVITSSTAAFQGTPYSAAYGATKAFDLLLAEGLWFEMADKGVDILALCPGATDTEGPKRTGVDASKVPNLMGVEPVVRSALDGLGRTPVVVPGALNRIAVGVQRWLPRRWSISMAGRMMLRVWKPS